MRFVCYDDDQLGLLTDDSTGVIALNDRLDIDGDEPLIEYIEGDYDVSEYVDEDSDHDIENVKVDSPVGRPGKAIAAPLNYKNHINKVLSDRDITTDEWLSIKDKMYFLKAPLQCRRPVCDDCRRNRRPPGPPDGTPNSMVTAASTRTPATWSRGSRRTMKAVHSARHTMFMNF